MIRHARVVHPAPGRLVPTEVAAVRYDLHPDTLRKWARTGRVPAFQVGTHYRFDLDALDEALAYAPADEDVG